MPSSSELPSDPSALERVRWGAELLAVLCGVLAAVAFLVTRPIAPTHRATIELPWKEGKVEIDVRGLSLYEMALGRAVNANSFGDTRRRLRDMRSRGHVDVVLAGASTAYRNIDTRPFEEAGLHAFNLGTSSQMPLHTYYLLERYASLLTPRIVVFDVSPVVEMNDVGDSVMDLLTAGEVPPWDGMKIALAARRYALFVWSATRFVVRPPEVVSSDPEALMGCSDYLDGHCTVARSRKLEAIKGWLADHPQPAETDNRKQHDIDQSHYIRKTVEALRARGARVMLVVSPNAAIATPDWRQKIAERAALAQQLGVDFYDGNTELPPGETFSFREDYDDYSHLNPRGARRWGAAILARLRARGLFP